MATKSKVSPLSPYSYIGWVTSLVVDEHPADGGLYSVKFLAKNGYPEWLRPASCVGIRLFKTKAGARKAITRARRYLAGEKSALHR